MRGKYFNNKQVNVKPMVQNRRDADKLISSTYKAFMLLSMMALRDEFKFGASRMQKYVDKMHDVLDSYNKGFINIDDLNKTIEEETGIKVIER